MEAAISTIAVFRDRWNIGDDHRSLGPDGAVKTIEAAGDRKHAQAATDLASRLYAEPRTLGGNPGGTREETRTSAFGSSGTPVQANSRRVARRIGLQP
jgi:hypothetical protein